MLKPEETLLAAPLGLGILSSSIPTVCTSGATLWALHLFVPSGLSTSGATPWARHLFVRVLCDLCVKILFFLFIPLWLTAGEPSPQKLNALYNSLDPKSVAQHLAFYELYGNTPQGDKALQHAWSLLSGNETHITARDLPLVTSVIPAVVALVNKQPSEELPDLSDDDIAGINALAARLPNRRLQGHTITSEQELQRLPPNQIDLARGLFLSQLGEQSIRKIESYEALLDLMALQILARVPMNASPQAKIRAMNDFIFDEMGFRFPPHSLYAKDIDTYTFLPSVLDSRKGVCLGVSILYLCLAQRLALPLEIVTPPGHIFVRYRSSDEIINIETTARGMNLDSDVYLGIETRSLQKHDIKEVIGMAHFNQASVFWHNQEYDKALEAYLKAKDFMPNDKLLTELMGYTYLFVGNIVEGKRLLNTVKDYLPDDAITKHTIAEDYLNGAVDADGIKAIFQPVDETRESILDKQKQLMATLEKYPRFRSGWFHLATTWLQLHRTSEALKTLERHHELDDDDPSAEYYLAVLYAQRMDYNKAWKHLRRTEDIVHSRRHNPKALQDARRELSRLSPE